MDYKTKTPADKKADQTTSNIVEMAQTISRGEAPSNVQMTKTLDTAMDSITERTREVELSSKGRDLAYDTKEVLAAAKNLIEEKNPDEKIQKIVTKGKEASIGLQRTGEIALEELEDPNLQYSADHLYDITRRLVYQMAYSKEMRVTLIEIIDILQNVFWRNVKLTQKELETATNKPVDVGQPTTGIKKDVYQPSQPFITQTQKPSLAQSLKSDVPFGQSTIATPSVTDTLKADIASGENTLPATTENVKQTMENIKDQFQNQNILPVKMTESEKRELNQRARILLRKLGKNEDYQRAVFIIFRLVDQLRLKADRIQQEPFQERTGRNLQQLWVDLQDMVERWAGKGRVQLFINNAKEFFNKVDNDVEAKSIYEDMKNMVTEVLKNPQLLDSDIEQRRLDNLIDRARMKMDDPVYRSYSDTLFTDARRILNNITNDPATRQFTDSLAKFSQDVIRDRFGRPSLSAFQESLSQLRILLLPVFMKQLENIPVARVEGTGPKYDFILDNIKMSGYDILPEHVRLFFDTKVDVNLKEGPKNDVTKALLTLEVNNIKTHLRDIYFAYRRKTFPKVEDEGIADLDVTGSGTSIKLQWLVKSKGDQPLVMRVNKADCDVSGLKIRIKDAKHAWLDKMASGIFAGYVRRQLEDELENQLKEFGWTVADSMNDAMRKMSSFQLPSTM